jgi:tripartite-type tricarboxylate transporter receptor subunit TctC
MTASATFTVGSRLTLALAALGAASSLLAPSALAQTYPTKPVRMIIPFAPGGGSDFIGRIAAQQLTEAMGQAVLVENRGGAGGALGVEVGLKSAPDGYTLTLIAASYPVNPALYKLNFDPVKDMQPVIQMSQGPFLVAVNPSLPVKTIKDLIALARKSPGALNYATSGQGSIVHLATEHFASMAGIKINPIVYRGSTPGEIALVAGEVPIYIDGMIPALPLIQAGRVRA